jgi:EmrB/QacA subfamily drug resistance transporter
VRLPQRGRCTLGVFPGGIQQLIRLIQPKDANPSRPTDQLGIGPCVVVSLGPFRIVNGIGEVQRKVSAQNGQLTRGTRGLNGCFHRNPLYQLHILRCAGYVASVSTFGGNNPDNERTLALAVVCVAQFVVVLDVTIVTTALPAIRQALGFSDAQLQWVFTAYALVFGGLLIFGGRVADLAGRRRTFLIGLALFAVASAGCALAWSPGALVAARVLQGAGAALLSPAALSLLTTFTEPGESRRRAVGWWTAVAATGGASGWVLGGLISESVGWRWVFAVNVPIAAVALVVAPRALQADCPARNASRLDLGGALTATAGLALLVYGLTSAGERGLDRIASWLPLLLAAIAFVIFVRHEGRAADPLLPLGLLRSRPVAGANLTAMAITASTSPAMYLAVLYVQQVLGIPAGRASLLFPGVNLGVIVGSLAGPRLLGRLRARRTLVTGFGGIAIGTMMLLLLPDDGLPAVQLLMAFGVMGVGLGLASVASTQTGTDAADSAYRGVASGVLNSAAQVGTAVGVAFLLPLAAAVGLNTMTGYRIGFIGAGAIAAAGILASLLVPAAAHSRSKSPQRSEIRPVKDAADVKNSAHVGTGEP